MDPQEYALMDAVEDRMWWYRAMHARAVAALRALAPGAAVLDAGCGTGGFLARLGAARPDLRLHGVEYDPGAAARAAAKSGALVAAGTVNALPFADASFNALASLDVLCHRAVDQAAALAQFRRVLRPGGVLLLNLPAHEWLRSAHDARVHTARRYSRPALRSALEGAGFGEARCWHWNSLLLPLMAAQRKLLARRQDAASDVTEYPPWLDATLFAATEAERALSGLGLRFPAGGSVMALARR